MALLILGFYMMKFLNFFVVKGSEKVVESSVKILKNRERNLQPFSKRRKCIMEQWQKRHDRKCLNPG